jgi:autotransporter adhesin
VAIGTDARAQSPVIAGTSAQSSVAVGTAARAIGTNTTAVGDHAVASADFAVAIGGNSNASHENSVAIGNGSTTSAPNTVSVGYAGNERRVTHVAAASEGTDAVNLTQLNAALAAVSSNFGAAQGYTDLRFDAAMSYTDQQAEKVRAYAARGIAASLAMPTVAPSEAGKTAFGIGTGYHDGETAVGLALAHAFTEDFQLSGGVAKVHGGRNVARVAVGFEF